MALIVAKGETKTLKMGITKQELEKKLSEFSEMCTQYPTALHIENYTDTSVRIQVQNNVFHIIITKDPNAPFSL